MAQENALSPTGGDQHVHIDRGAPSPPAPSLSPTMPGSTEHAAQEIESVSPEGRPADAAAGPGALRGLMLVPIAIIFIAALASMYWIGWPGAIVAIVIGFLGLIANPVMGAANSRAGERAQVIRDEQPVSQSNAQADHSKP